jgi:trigger factor
LKVSGEVFERATITASEPTLTSRVWEVALTESDAGDLKKRVLKEQAREFDIPGFRKGKVPLDLVRSRLGEGFAVIYADRVGEAFLEWQRDKQGIPLVLDVDYEMSTSGDNGEILTVKADIVPPFSLPPYRGLKGTLRKRRIEDRDVEAFLEEAKRSHATLEPKDGALEASDVAEISLRRVAEGGIPLIGEELRQLRVILKPDTLPRELFDSLVGMEEGQTCRVTLQKDQSTLIQAPSGTNQQDFYEVEVLHSFQVTTPSGEKLASIFGVDDEEELPIRLRVVLEDDAEREGRRNLREELVTQIARATEIHLPPALVESRAEEIRTSLLESSTDNKGEVDPKLTDPSFFLEQHSESVELSLKELLVVEQIADREDLRATREQIDAAITMQSRENGVSPKRLMARLGNDGLRSLHRRITRSNVEDLLEDEAEVELSD